ncbi:hypothetical protein OUY22_09430 [Nonomuraea sp. MCN248]|uniref:Uncharacterized protein n=1 Tax=Nonomuraea corallina TaxID=2989783 RepID=A0ABT4S8U8_9ACTN|nr:hypothetical protein [Nonomuraea corallina]MDA0633638.1 hypothetical protein [Nonomuraea corallina]
MAVALVSGGAAAHADDADACAQRMQGTLAANPTLVSPGQNTTLSWNVTVTATPEDCPGTFGQRLDTTPVRAQDSTVVQLNQTRTFELRGFYRTPDNITVHRTLASRTVTVQSCTITPVVLPAQELAKFIPPHTNNGADRDFNANGPQVAITTSLRKGLDTSGRATRVEVLANMSARETKSDFTQASGSRLYTLYTAPADGSEIIAVTHSSGGPVTTSENVSYTDTDHAIDVLSPSSTSSFVDYYAVYGDGLGPEAGIHTGVSTTLKSLRVTLSKCSPVPSR